MNKLHSIPDLDFPWPSCPICSDGGEMHYDDTWYCASCGASWDSAGRSDTITCEECVDEYEEYAKVDGRFLCEHCAHVETGQPCPECTVSVATVPADAEAVA